jgi:hypothetical protein
MPQCKFVAPHFTACLENTYFNNAQTKYFKKIKEVVVSQMSTSLGTHIFTINQASNIASTSPNTLHYTQYSSIYSPFGVAKHIQGLYIQNRNRSNNNFMMQIKLKTS